MDKQSKSIRDGFGEGLLELVKSNPLVVVLTADLADSTRVEAIKKERPQQFVECGISEQNMMGVAAGLALAGKIPFVNSYAVFNPGRNWDQLRVSVCYQNLNVKIIGHHSGFSACFDGATHQGLEDIAITRVLPNLSLVVPCDGNEARAAVSATIHRGPIYLRIAKTVVSEVTKLDKPFEFGKGEVLKPGKDLTIAVTGVLTGSVLRVAQALQSELDIEVVKFSTLKPFDSNLLLKSVQKTKKVITVEDHQIAGGFGSLVAEIVSEHQPVPVFRHGVKDTFGESGSEAELLAKHKLDEKGIIEVIKGFV